MGTLTRLVLPAMLHSENREVDGLRFLGGMPVPPNREGRLLRQAPTAHVLAAQLTRSLGGDLWPDCRAGATATS
jgi:hypothetical protein